MSDRFSRLVLTFFVLTLVIIRLNYTLSFPISSSSAENSSADDGVCGGWEEFPVNCPVSCFRTDPVCGVDGVTYWCGCADAVCSGARVAKLGFCDVGGGENGSFSGQALLLVQIVWLILLGFFVVFGHL